MKTKINAQNLSVTIIDKVSHVSMRHPENISTYLKDTEDVGTIACLEFGKGSDRVGVFLTEKDVGELNSAVTEIEEFFAKINYKNKANHDFEDQPHIKEV